MAWWAQRLLDNHRLHKHCLLNDFPVLQRVLKAYAGRLVGRLPKTATGATTATATAHTTDWQVGAKHDSTISPLNDSLVIKL